MRFVPRSAAGPHSYRWMRTSAIAGVLLIGAAACSSGSSAAGSSTSAASASSSSAGAAGSASASAAPSSGAASTVAGGTCATANTKLQLGFVYADTTQNPFQEMALGAKAAADADGNVDLSETAPTGVNNTQEVSLFQASARKSKDGVAYETIAPNLFVRALNDATDAGVPIVAVDAAPPAGTKVKTFVANSNTTLGQLLGTAFVASNPSPTGTVVLGNDIPSLPLLSQRLDGLTSVIKAKLPQMKIVGPLNSGSTPTDNYNLWKSIVSSNSSAVAFIGVGGQDGVSLPLIAKQTSGKWLAGSADIPPEALTAVKAGQIFALSSPEHWMKGYIAMHLLIQAKRTCTPIPTGWWNSGNLLIDKSNVDAVIARQQSPATRTAYFKSQIDSQLAKPPLLPINQAN